MLNSAAATIDNASSNIMDEAIVALEHAVAALGARTGSPADGMRLVCAALRAADRLTATAITCLDDGLETPGGLPAELVLRLEARRTGAEARTITHAATQLRAMPHLTQAFNNGDVSWGQVRAITAAVTRLDPTGRTAIDQHIHTNAGELRTAEPDELISQIDHHVNKRRPDLQTAREDRAIQRSFLAIQGRLDGSASLYGETDAQSAATLIQALDTTAPPPTQPNPDQPSRAQQRMDALIAICEATLAGTNEGTRPRPRLLATIDINNYTADLLWALPGRPAHLSPVATNTLLCDATIIPITFHNTHPIAVGNAATVISGKVRTALIARDHGCRFPGCGAPAAWCDAHHITPGRGNQAHDLVLLCRRCHRRIHRHRWRIRHRDDGTITFTHRGRTYTSPPRRGPPPSPA